MQYIVHLFLEYTSLRLRKSWFTLSISIFLFAVILIAAFTPINQATVGAASQNVGQVYDDPDPNDEGTYTNLLDPDAPEDKSGSSTSSVSNTDANKSDVLSGIGASTDTADSVDAGVSGIIGTIVSVLSLVVGIVAIIFVIVSGYKYITAAGDSAKISSAKTTLIYAIVGLTVAALSKFLVNFVFSTV